MSGPSAVPLNANSGKLQAERKRMAWQLVLAMLALPAATAMVVFFPTLDVPRNLGIEILVMCIGLAVTVALVGLSIWLPIRVLVRASRLPNPLGWFQLWAFAQLVAVLSAILVGIYIMNGIAHLA